MKHFLLKAIGVDEDSRTSTKFSYLIGFLTLVFTLTLAGVLSFNGKLESESVDLIRTLLVFVGAVFSVNVSRIAVESVAGKKEDSDAAKNS